MRAGPGARDGHGFLPRHKKSVALYYRVQRVKVLDVFWKNLRIFLKNIFTAEIAESAEEDGGMGGVWKWS
jgi:hypothetical protein